MLAYPGISDKVVMHCDRIYDLFAGADMTTEEYQFLLKLLNAAYPEGQG